MSTQKALELALAGERINALTELRKYGMEYVQAVHLLESLLVKEQLRVTQNSLRVLLAWCDRMLIDDKHLIGSICKQADDTSFRHAISTAEKILKGAN